MRDSTPAKKRPGSLAPSLRRLFFLGTLLIILGFGLLSTFGNNGILDLLKLQSLERVLQNENAKLLKEQEDLKAEVFRLQEPKYVEYLARERLGLMRPNEVFVILDAPQPHSPVDN
jgi:cell division protein FtsB